MLSEREARLTEFFAIVSKGWTSVKLKIYREQVCIDKEPTDAIVRMSVVLLHILEKEENVS